MKILFVSAFLNPIEKPINGDAQRTQLLLKACATIASIDVVTFAGKAREEVDVPDNVRIVFDKKLPCRPRVRGRLEKWVSLFSPNIESFFPVIPSWEESLDSILSSEQYDLIVTRYLPRAISCGLWKYRDRLVVDFDDALPFYFINQITADSSWSFRVRMRMASKKAVGISRKAVDGLYAAFFAREADALSNKGYYLPNIPFCQDRCRDATMSSPKKRILFVGQLEYEPNREGLDYFLEFVYLPLCQRVPDLEMHLVGYIADKNLRQHWQNYPGVTVTGFVEDLKQEYEQSHVAVVPVYRCGATNIKLLEAMAMNRACVSTMEAFEKLRGRFENGKDLYAASNDAEFVEMLERLLTNETENHRIAHNAKTVMDNYYSFDCFCEIVKNAIVK